MHSLFFEFFFSLIVFLSVAPSLTRHPGSGELVVKKGSTVSLKCQASGFPSPKVYFIIKKCQYFSHIWTLFNFEMKLNDEGWSRTLNAKYIFIISTDNFLWSYPRKLSTFSIRIFELDLVILQFMNAKDKNFLKDVWKIFGPSQTKFLCIIFCLRSVAKPPI